VAELPQLRRLLGWQTRPAPEVSRRQATEPFLDDAAVHDYPAGSCAMGQSATRMRSPAPRAGWRIEALHVADASLILAVTSGNTNMPTTVIGERIAWPLLGRQTRT
jgi:choline dehydrogenase